MLFRLRRWVGHKCRFTFPKAQSTGANDCKHDDCGNYPKYSFHCTLHHRGFLWQRAILVPIARTALALKHAEKRTSGHARENLEYANGMPRTEKPARKIFSEARGAEAGLALSLAGSSGTPANRFLGPPHNCQPPAVLLALSVGCLPLAVEAEECEVLRIGRSYSGS